VNEVRSHLSPGWSRFHVHSSRARQLGLIVVAVLIFIVRGLQGSGYASTLILTSMLFAITGLSVVLVTGLAGQISLTQVAMMGLSAYITGILAGTSITAAGTQQAGLVHPGSSPSMSYLSAALIAIAVTTVFGMLIGVPALRIRGLHLALVSLALAYMLQVVLFSNGYVSANLEDVSLARPPLLNSDTKFLWVAFGLLSLACLTTRNLMRSSFGRALNAVRDSEVAASTVGLNVAVVKTLAFGISSLYAAVAGVLFIALTGNLGGAVLNLDVGRSLLLLGVVVIGGLRSVTGGVVAGLLFVHLPEWIADLAGPGYVPIVAGIGVIVLAIGLPEGLSGLPARVFEFVQVRRSRTEVAA